MAWAVTNCHMLARRALARSTSPFDREKWEHVLRICEKAGARSPGVLRDSLPTEITEGSPIMVSDVQSSSAPCDFRCTCGHWKRNHNDTGCTVCMVGPIERTCQCQKFECRDLCATYESDMEFRGEQEPRS